MKKNQKKILGILLTVTLIGFLLYLGFNKNVDQAYSMKLDNFERNLTELETERETIDEKIKTVYADEDQTYILESLKKKKIDEINEKILMYDEKFVGLNEELQDLTARDQRKQTNKMKKSGINDSLKNYYISIDDLKTKKELTNLINDLFSTKYMRDAKVDTDVFISEELDSSQFMRTYNLINQKLNNTELKNIEKYSKTLYEGLKIAEEQLDDLNQAIELRDEIFNENDFLVLTDNEKIEEFQLAVEKIKNPELKSSFDEFIRKTQGYNVEEPEEIEENQDTKELETDQSDKPSNTGGTNGNSTPDTEKSDNTNNKKPSNNNGWKPKPNKKPKDPVDRPKDPVDPPKDPVDPPKDPVDPPKDPVDPPKDPVDPPKDPVDPPKDPADPPKDQVDPPKKPSEPIE